LVLFLILQAVMPFIGIVESLIYWYIGMKKRRMQIQPMNEIVNNS
jgi:hypothetical protein